MQNTSNTSVDASSFSFAKFLPGLVLGVVVGGFAGAFFPPVVQTWASLPPDPVSHGPRADAQPRVANGADHPRELETPEPVAIGTATEGR